MANSYGMKMSGLKDKRQPGEDINAFRERMKGELDIEPEEDKLDLIEDPEVKQYIIKDKKVRRRRAQQSREIRSKLIDMATTPLERPPVKLEGAIDRAHAAVSKYFIKRGELDKLDEFEKLFAERELPKVRLQKMQESGMTAEQAQDELQRQDRELEERRGKWLADLLEPYRDMKPENFTNKSLEYINENFEELFFVHELAMNIEPGVRNYIDENQNGEDGIRYKPEDYARIKFVRELYQPLGTCTLQAYLAANPYYALFDTEKCIEELDSSVEKCMRLSAKDLTEFGDLFTDVGLGGFHKRSGGPCAIGRLLRENGIDPKEAQYETMDGEKIDINSPDGRDYIYHGNAVYVTAGDKKMLVRVDTPEEDKDIVARANETPAELFNVNYADTLSVLNEIVNDADPWYIRSSQQFRTMKQTLTKLTKLGEMPVGGDDLSEVQRKEIVDTMKELEQNCQSYLDFKGTEGKNDLERERIEAVQQVLHVAKVRSGILNRAEELQQGIEASQRISNPMQEAQDAKKFMTQGLSYADIPANGNERLEEVNNNIHKAFDDDRDKIYECIDPHKGAPTDKLQGEQLETAKNIVAMMTIKAMIVNDQASQKAKNEPNKPGPVDKVFNQVTVKQFDTFVKSRPAFENVMNNMTREGLYKFVTENGARMLAKDIVAVIVEKSHEQSEPSAQAQIEKNGSEVQKQEQSGLVK